MQPRIRLAQPEDIEAVLRLERETIGAAHWSRDQYQRIFRAKSPARLCLVAESDELQGFLVAQAASPEWELENLVVAPRVRRRGVGKQLMQQLIEQGQASGATAILLEVRASNDAGRALYQVCGFAQVGVRRRYYREPEEDAIIYKYNYR